MSRLFESNLFFRFGLFYSAFEVSHSKFRVPPESDATRRGFWYGKSEIPSSGPSGVTVVMKFEEYRVEYAEFHAARESARLDGWRRDLPDEPLPERIFDRFSDLFSISGVETLRRERNRVATAAENERRGVAVLLAEAERRFVAAWVRPLSVELARARTRPFISWNDEKLSAVTAAARATAESDPIRRADLHRRLVALTDSIADLRAERREKVAEAVGKLGYDTVHSFLKAAQPAFGPTPEHLLSTCERFLDATDEEARRRAASFALRLSGNPTATDLARLDARAGGENEFPARRLKSLVSDALRPFGIRTWQQPNFDARATADGTTVAARIRVPGDIRLRYAERSGRRAFAGFLDALARAQHAAWTSPDLPVELRSGGDPAVANLWGLLFERLLDEPRWLGECLDIVDGKRFTADRLRRLRRDALVLVTAWRVAGGMTPGETLTAEFGERMGIRLTDGELAAELDDAPGAAARLRAALVEARLRDWLKTRYGAWWQSRRAGDALIDLWNTGFRHSLDELAAQIGFGDPGLDALLEDLNVLR